MHDAELTSEISSVLLGELDDIFGTIVEDARIELAVPPGVTVEAIGLSGSPGRDGGHEVFLGPLQEGIERVAVFRIVCPRAEAGQELEFKLAATGRTIAAGAYLEADAGHAHLTAARGSANNDQHRDEELASIVARTWSAQIVAVAAKMNRDGAHHEAKRYVERELRHFARYAQGLEGGHAMVRELELLARRVDRDLSPRMQKEMVLQSALVMESRADRRGPGKAAWSERLERGD